MSYSLRVSFWKVSTWPFGCAVMAARFIQDQRADAVVLCQAFFLSKLRCRKYALYLWIWKAVSVLKN